MIDFSLPDNILETSPTIHPTAFVAEGARVMGAVELKAHSSIWYNCVLRGDINRIVIGERTNIQDGVIVHLENNLPCLVGDDVVVGHQAVLHGCTIGDGCLIGIGAILLSGAVIKSGSIIGAGALILEGQIIEENSLVVGSPGKVIRQTPADTAEKNKLWASKYVELAKIHRSKFGNSTVLL